MAVSSGAPEIKGFLELPARAVTAMVWVSDARLRSPLVLTTADAELIAVTPDLKVAAGEPVECKLGSYKSVAGQPSQQAACV